MENKQKGIIRLVPMLSVVAAVGIISFLLVSSTAPFGSNLFGRLFSKPSTNAAFSSNDWPQLQYSASRSGISPQGVVGPYSVKWRLNSVPLSGRVQPIVVAGKVYIGSDNGNMYAIDINTGATIWQFPTGNHIVDSAGFSYTTNFLYFGSTDGYVYALDTTKTPTDPTFVAWKKQTGGEVKVAPLIANNKIYIGSDDGVMHAYNETDGTETTFTADNNVPILSTAAYNSGTNTIYFGGEDSKVYALDANSLTLKWKTQVTGQGFASRWPVVINSASGTKIILASMPSYQFHDLLSKSCSVQTRLAPSSNWAAQKAAYISYLQANPYERVTHVLDGVTGVEDQNNPILFGVDGKTTPPTAPIGTNDTDTKVIYRFFEPGYTVYSNNPTCFITNNYTWLYAGQWNIATEDITNLDSMGAPTATSADWTKKAALISDEDTVLSQGGNNLYFVTWRGAYVENLTTKTFSGIIQGNNDPNLYFLPYANPLFVMDATHPEGPKGESFVEDERPMVIANGMLFFHAAGTLVAISGTAQ